MDKKQQTIALPGCILVGVTDCVSRGKSLKIEATAKIEIKCCCSELKEDLLLGRIKIKPYSADMVYQHGKPVYWCPYCGLELTAFYEWEK